MVDWDEETETTATERVLISQSQVPGCGPGPPAGTHAQDLMRGGRSPPSLSSSPLALQRLQTGCKSAGCVEHVSGWEGSVGPPSFFFARFRGELKEEGEDWDSNGVMSGW